MQLPSTPSFRLEGRRALVVGASRSIGLACAVALAEHGAHVTLAARSFDALKEVATAIMAAGYKADVLPLDISDVDSMALSIKGLPAFDIVVNSAGIARHAHALDTQEADLDAVINVNFKAAYFLAQETARKMIKEGKPGCIINMSSQMGHIGGLQRAVYSASKHAVEGMTKSMAMEFGEHNVRVNTICPTFIRTPLTESTFEDKELSAWIDSKIKLPRVGEVTDLMGAVVFLASDAAQMITGTALMVDGGWTAG